MSQSIQATKDKLHHWERALRGTMTKVNWLQPWHCLGCVKYGLPFSLAVLLNFPSLPCPGHWSWVGVTEPHCGGEARPGCVRAPHSTYLLSPTLLHTNRGHSWKQVSYSVVGGEVC